jgi:LytR cell envelope-related transcriptional attenuator
MVLAGAGALVLVLVLVLAVSALKGGGSTPTAVHSSPPSKETPVTSAHKASSGVASRPAETAVVVLNGTSTPDLAHHLAADLQQGGYTLAAASAAVPPGARATTEVQYTRGHRPEARAVAKALNVTQVHSIESAVAQLAGPATVVVLAGADQASQLGGAQSNGEPAGGAGAEGTPAGQ